MRLLIVLLCFATAGAAACSDDEPDAAASPSPIAATAVATPGSTPPAGASSILRLDTFEPVYEAFVAGRIPAGLLNETTIALAGVRFSGFYIGEDSPQDLYFELAIVGASSQRRELAAIGGHSYEWWFTTIPEEPDGRYPVFIKSAEPVLKIALRYVDGAWATYVDDGGGWQPVEGTLSFGEYEITARVRVDERWPTTQLVYTYMRALIRHEQPTEAGYQVGDVWPDDLSWGIVTR